jgi:hypothetical protein
MKRDSRWWWFVMGGAIVTAMSSRMDLLDRILPAQHTDMAHALIELAALIVGVAAGVMRASPLDLSDKGRRKYAAKANTVRLDR